MRIIFLGTPEFAVNVLDEINKSSHEVVAVITQPDRINGRNNKVLMGAVKTYAVNNGLDVYQFNNISVEGEEIIRSLRPDVMVTCAYGQILRQNILDICPILNIHASLLPKYRGSSPVQWALINGEKEVGVTVMRTELGVDTGDMLDKDSVVLNGDENSAQTLELLSNVGAKLIVRVLDKWALGTIVAEKQDESQATHCRMLTKQDGKIDFSLSSQKLHDFVRGVNPWPSAFTKYNGAMIKFIKTEICDCSGGKKTGEIVLSDAKNGMVVKCGDGYIRPLIIQGENGKAMDVKAYLLGHSMPIGSCFGE